jgi:methionyl-tRNA formyltransferase
MRLMFCGTPQFAVPTLQALLEAGHAVELVLTQPDRAAGRGMEMRASPVKQVALQSGLPLLQPEKIRTNDALQSRLQAITPDAIVVVAYGRLIPPWMLDLPRFGNLNLHASLLPKYRGAAPIQWAIANGEVETGATVMRLDEGLDTGDILLQRKVAIAPDETSLGLSASLAAAGASLMIEALAGLEAGMLHPEPQDNARATLAPILKKEDGRIDWNRTAEEIYNRWRGFQPWPGAFASFRGKNFIVHSMRVADAPADAAPPGAIKSEEGRLLAACGVESWLELLEVQMEGKRRMDAGAFLRGISLQSGERLQ